MEEASALPRKEARNAHAFAKTCLLLQATKLMSAVLGFVTHRASDSPIQALKPRKSSGNSTTEHAECASLFALF